MRIILFCMAVMLSVGQVCTGVAGAESNSKTLSPYFFVEGGQEGQERFPLKATTVKAVITGVIADVTVSQEYANAGTDAINARYIFPASTRAAVHGMRMTVGEEVIEARIKERQEAKQAFVRAKAAGQSASLLEQDRPNVFSMNVANIMPGETVTIDLHYSELLVPESGMYAFVFPTVVGPRYSTVSETGAADHHQWLENPYLTADLKPTSTFDIQVTLAAGMPIQQVACGTHTTDVDWQSETQAQVNLSSAETDGGNRDFILEYRLSGDRIHSGLLLHQGEEENFFLLMVQPPQRVTPESMPPREYIFVLDVSGSMHGFPLDTAKVLMRQLLAGLRPVDRFNLILFAGSARLLAPQSVPAQADRVQAALDLIDGQQGGGGTELAQALTTGLGLPYEDGYARTMVVVTDGYIAADKEVFGLIADQTGHCNIFTFGIGSSVNRYLIEGLARAGQGEPFVVTEPEAAQGAAARFKSYIEAPVLTGIDIDFGEFDAYQVEPVHPADLFAQRPLIISGKWRGQPQGAISLTGTAGSGPFHQGFDVAQSIPSGTLSALPYLWVRQRLGRITDFASTPDDEDTRRQVTQLGLKYTMLTAYTSFVAVHQQVRNTAGPARDVKQPLPMPHNVSNLAVGSRNVPEPDMGMMLALLAAMALVIVWRRQRLKRA